MIQPHEICIYILNQNARNRLQRYTNMLSSAKLDGRMVVAPLSPRDLNYFTVNSVSINYHPTQILWYLGCMGNNNYLVLDNCIFYKYALRLVTIDITLLICDSVAEDQAAKRPGWISISFQLLFTEQKSRNTCSRKSSYWLLIFKTTDQIKERLSLATCLNQHWCHHRITGVYVFQPAF